MKPTQPFHCRKKVTRHEKDDWRNPKTIDITYYNRALCRNDHINDRLYLSYSLWRERRIRALRRRPHLSGGSASPAPLRSLRRHYRRRSCRSSHRAYVGSCNHDHKSVDNTSIYKPASTHPERTQYARSDFGGVDFHRRILSRRRTDLRFLCNRSSFRTRESDPRRRKHDHLLPPCRRIGADEIEIRFTLKTESVSFDMLSVSIPITKVCCSL